MISLYDITNVSHMAPRRVMRYVLVYCKSGCISIMVDDKDLMLRKGEAITITSGQYHAWKPLGKAIGQVLEFTLDFFCKDDNDIELIFHNGLFCHFDMNEVIPVDAGIIGSQLDLIGRELDAEPYQYLISIHSRIELILVAINRAKVDRGDEIWKPDALFLKFLDMVRGHFVDNWPVMRFARELGTTELKLNELSKTHAGKTAQLVIHGLIVSEAKRLLTYEDVSVKEVAYRLGFDDPFYFSNFFKKHAKLSPKQYQASHAR